MTPTPRYTLKAILVVILALSVPLAMIAAGSKLGLPCLVLVTCGCVGGFLGGRDGVLLGLLLSVLAVPIVLSIAAVLSMGDF